MPRGGSSALAGTGGGGGLESLLSLVWMLVCVVVIIVLAYLFTKYVAGRGIGTVNLSGSQDRFKVLSRLSLGRDQSAVLVKAGEKYLLLGVAPSGITLLAELTAEEAASWEPPPAGQEGTGFKEAFLTIMKQKGRR